MKRFVIKFYALFAIILGVVGYYAWFVKPQISGDIGRIGQIPFGREYDERMEMPYRNIPMNIHEIRVEEDITDSIITIGDSFSQHFGALGYNNFLANSLGVFITNITKFSESPEQTFIQLVSNNKIPQGSIVIVESVERACVIRLNELNMEDTVLTINPIIEDNKAKQGLLDEAIIWLRLVLGMKNPICVFKLDRELFTHETRHNELYIYDSKWSHDGDLRFAGNLNESAIEEAWKKLYLLHDFAEKHSITMLYLIAADKYDVYEPFIIDEHAKNPTLDKCPNEQWIINTKPLLQAKVYDGERDVYSINNTHWSPKGSEIVGNEIAKRLFFVAK